MQKKFISGKLQQAWNKWRLDFLWSKYGNQQPRSLLHQGYEMTLEQPRDGVRLQCKSSTCFLFLELWTPKDIKKMFINNNSQKMVVSVDLLCSKCRKKVMKLISSIEGVNSIVLDPSKNTATIIGEADPVRIIKKVRKFRSSAHIVSIGPPKDDKKDSDKKDSDKKDTNAAIMPALPRTCQKCDVWYVVGQDYYTPCHIL